MTLPRAIRPFRAVLYDDSAGSAADLLAPPYDVIDSDDARRLRRRSPFNAVRLIRPDRGDGDPYAAVARRWRSWLERGVLGRTGSPFLFAYGQRFDHGGVRRTRRGLFGALALPEPPAGRRDAQAPGGGGPDRLVLPHERTHSGPRRDRLRLMTACEAQLSSIFLVAGDPEERLADLLERAATGPSALEATTPDGIEHSLRAVKDGELAGELCRAVASGSLLIADGHHRYETALELARRWPNRPSARRTLACVVSERDPGLLLLPTHRALRRPPGEESWEAALRVSFELEVLESPDPAKAVAAARRASPGAMALAGGRRSRGLLLRPRPRALDATGLRPRADRVASFLFDRLLLRAAFGLDADAAAESGLLTYHRNPETAVSAAGREGAAFLLPPPDVQAVRELAVRGELFPPKSTYFWPKIPSGLLFRMLEKPVEEPRAREAG